MTVAGVKRRLHLESQTERKSSMRILIAVTGLVLCAVLLGAVLSGSAPTASGTQTYPSVVLAQAAGMTQQMSAPAGVAPTYQPHAGDEQLRLSADVGFVRQLEAYQAGIDRMLARTP